MRIRPWIQCELNKHFFAFVEHPSIKLAAIDHGTPKTEAKKVSPVAAKTF